MRHANILVRMALALGLLAIGYMTVKDIQMPIEGQDTHTGPVGQIVNEKTVGQTFLARYNHLHRIDLFMGTYARTNTHEVLFHLKTDPEASNEIFTLSFNASQVQDAAYRSFTFPPIPNSAGRTFYFYLESPASYKGNAITLWMQAQDLYPQGRMFRNGTPQTADLRFQAFYQASYQDRMVALLDRLVENKPSIWGEKWFYLLLAVLTLVSAAWLLAQSARLLTEDKDH